MTTAQWRIEVEEEDNGQGYLAVWSGGELEADVYLPLPLARDFAAAPRLRDVLRKLLGRQTSKPHRYRLPGWIAYEGYGARCTFCLADSLLNPYDGDILNEWPHDPDCPVVEARALLAELDA